MKLHLALLAWLICTSSLMAQESGSATEGTLPEIEVRPPADTDVATVDQAVDNTEPFDVWQAYPSLADQILNSSSGALRTRRSVFDDPRHVSIIDRQALDERVPHDMGRALETEVGVMVQRTGRGQASPFIRGLTGQQVLILVDGVRLNNSIFRAGPNQYFNQIDPGMVERIEVVRGPGSVQWGSDAIGGVINIVTQSPEFIGTDYLTGGTVQRFSTADTGYYGRVTIEGWVGNSGFIGGGSYGNFNLVDRGGGLGRQPATSFNQHAGDLKFSHAIDRFSEVVVALQHFQQDDVFRTDRFEQGDRRVFGPQSRDMAYVRWHGEPPCNCWFDTYSLTASYHLINQIETRNPTTDPPFTSESVRRVNVDQVGVNLVLGSDLGIWGRLTYGFDWYHDDVDSSRTDRDLTTNPATVTERAGSFPDDGFYSQYGVFAEWDVALTDRLQAVSGVRYSWIDAGATVTAGNAVGEINPSYDDVTASIGLTYEINPHWHVVGSVAEGFRAPNLDDLAANSSNVFAGQQIPNPGLRPERSLNYEIGLKTDTDRLRSTVFFFWTDLRDHILRQPVGNPLDPSFVLLRENRNSILRGVEWSGELLLAGGWSTYGNFSYAFGKDTVVDEPLSRIPPAQGIAGLRWRNPSGGDWFDVYGWFVGPQTRLSARDLADTVRIPAGGTPGYATLNFRYGRVLAGRHRLSAAVENVTDTLYRVHGSGADGPGVNLLLSYELLR